ncbi:Transferase [Parasponia andersonii]|uniref:Transferase n=1 Tax=Parasponia andersonii TaxID=3476 RepID=A0A2P5CUN9_PARAD|nr:Transferase [Parasponia andersonii]
MAEQETKVEIISRETIKPCSPTPPHLKSYELSSLDLIAPAVYGRVVYFYTAQSDDTSAAPEEKSQQLKKSLSQSLARFYPFAGRIVDNIAVECNDDGAQYVEARFNGLLSTFLEQRNNPALIELFFPAAIKAPEAATWPLLLVQATFFDCGGVAVVPVFDSASYFPLGYKFSFEPPASGWEKPLEWVTKMFVFDTEKIADLKAKTAGDRVQQPSRVEVVTALIWKCAMAASRSDTAGIPKKTFWVTQAMDIRRRAEPPMPEHLVGNLVTIIPSQTNHDERELELPDVVAELRKGLREFNQSKTKRLRGDGAVQVIFEIVKELIELLIRDDADGLMVTSLCTFKLYEIADFGWGKPTWVNILPLLQGVSKLVALMDTRDGGVEAWVTLSEKEMALFERDPELLEFATQNYSAI